MFQKTTLPLHAEVSSSRHTRNNLTLTEIQCDSISKIAEKHFPANGKKVKWDPKAVEQVMENELVPSNFASHKLLLLEFTQYLENVRSQ